jgi:hypothetical protein
MRAHQDQRRAAGLAPGLLESALYGIQIVAIANRLRVPTIGIKSFADVFAEAQIGGRGQRNTIVVIQINQFSQLQMSRHTGGFRSDAFHDVAVADDGISEMVDDLEPGTVIARRQIRFSDCHADAVAETLSERSSGDFYTGSELAFRMPGRQASPLTELLDLIERQIVTGKMKHAIEQHGPVPR